VLENIDRLLRKTTRIKQKPKKNQPELTNRDSSIEEIDGVARIVKGSSVDTLI